MRDAGEKTIISAQVPGELRDELAQLARQHDLSLSDEIRKALRLHLRVEDPGVFPPLRPDSPASAADRVKAAAVEPPQRAGQEEGA
jgi:hypothetical protein